MLRINDVVMLEDIRYRILDTVDIGYFWINIDSDKSFPELITRSEVEDGILSERLKTVDDPFSHLVSRIPVPQQNLWVALGVGRSPSP
ncbi:MAG: hypothetical protein PHI97_19280 [Desulfobulbus sp.]|nr:hypothetical protein [Desulfobulbus sp.]